MAGIPSVNFTRFEVDASDVTNIVGNHSGQSGSTAGWLADTGYTLGVTTSAPSRNGNALQGAYTGGKTISITSIANVPVNSRVKSPAFNVIPGQYLGATVNVADSLIPTGNNRLYFQAGVEYYDVNGNPLTTLGLDRTVVTESASAGWNMVTVDPIGWNSSAPIPANTVTARVVFALAVYNTSTQAVTYPAHTTYVSKLMVATSSNLLSVSSLNFSDNSGVAWQNIIGNSTSVRIIRGGDIKDVVDEMDAGTLSATILDPELDPRKNDRLRIGRPCRVTELQADGVTWLPIFTGRLRTITAQYPTGKIGGDLRPRIVLTAVDAYAELQGIQAPFNYSGALGSKVRALMALSTVPYNTDAGTASTTPTSNDENASLWEQLQLAANSFYPGKLYIDRTGTLQCRSFSSTTPVYNFGDRTKVQITNLACNPSYEAS